MGFYSENELKNIGLKIYGNNVLISDKASIYSPHMIEIGDNVRIDDFCLLSGKIILGSFIHIAAYTAFFGGTAGITVKDFANFSSRISIYAVNDDYSGETMTNPMVSVRYKNVEQLPVLIGKHCILGCGCTVLPGVIIGDGASIGAMSLIKQSCEPWTIYAGVPCKKIRKRSNKLLQLEESLRKDLKSDREGIQ